MYTSSPSSSLTLNRLVTCSYHVYTFHLLRCIQLLGLDCIIGCFSLLVEYFRIHFDSSNHPEVRHSSSLVTIISSPGGGREELLTEKPLFWTSIVSMTIAAAATTAIIVLCIRRRKPRGSLGGSVERDENSRERTLSETSDDKDPGTYRYRSYINNQTHKHISIYMPTQSVTHTLISVSIPR